MPAGDGQAGDGGGGSGTAADETVRPARRSRLRRAWNALVTVVTVFACVFAGWSTVADFSWVDFTANLVFALLFGACGLASGWLLLRHGLGVAPILATLGLFYVPAFAAAVVREWDNEPRLPDVRLERAGPSPESGAVEGKLLANAGGYWHVFDEGARTVVAVANGNVGRATIVRPGAGGGATSSPGGATPGAATATP